MSLYVLRGSTPTFKYTFRVVDPADIAVAYLTISQFGTNVIEKTLADAEVGADSLTWTLTQDETLALDDAADAEAQLRYRLRDNSAHGTKPQIFRPGKIFKDGEI